MHLNFHPLINFLSSLCYYLPETILFESYLYIEPRLELFSLRLVFQKFLFGYKLQVLTGDSHSCLLESGLDSELKCQWQPERGEMIRFLSHDIYTEKIAKYVGLVSD